MSNAPYLAPGARDGLRLGHGKLVDSMIHDGLWDPYGDKHMGSCAEICAREYALQPRGAGRLRAARATAAPARRPRAAPPPARSCRSRSPGRKGPTVVDRDEEPFQRRPREDGSLRPAFQRGRHGHRRQRQQDQRRRRGAGADHRRARGEPRQEAASRASSRRPRLAQKPEWFTTAPVAAIQRALDAPASPSPTSTSSRSTRRSRWWRWPACTTSAIPHEQRQRARRRGGARPPHRRLRRAHPGHAAARARRARRALRLRRHLHRRRRSHGGGGGAARLIGSAHALAGRLLLSMQQTTRRPSTSLAFEPDRPRRGARPRRRDATAVVDRRPGALRLARGPHRRDAAGATARLPAAGARADDAAHHLRPEVPARAGGGKATGSARRARLSARGLRGRVTGGVELHYQDVTVHADGAVDRPRHQGARPRSGNVVIDQGPRRLSGASATSTSTPRPARFKQRLRRYVQPDYLLQRRRDRQDRRRRLRHRGRRLHLLHRRGAGLELRASPRPLEVEGYAHVKNARMRVKKVPVLYLPYILWPAKTDRTSGLLVPNIGYSHRRGAYLGLAYYQVLGPQLGHHGLRRPLQQGLLRPRQRVPLPPQRRDQRRLPRLRHRRPGRATE